MTQNFEILQPKDTLTDKEVEDRLTAEGREELYIRRMNTWSKEGGQRPSSEEEIETYLRELDSGLHDMSRDQLLYYRHFLEGALKFREERLEKIRRDRIDKIVSIFLPDGIPTKEEDLNKSIENINTYIAKINSVLNGDEDVVTETKKTKEEGYTLEISEFTVEFCISGLNQALDEENLNHDNINTFKDALEKARIERQLLLERIITNPDTEFKDDGNMVTDQEKIESSISRIDQALASISAKKTNEEVADKPEKREITHRPIINEINAYFSKYDETIERGDGKEIDDLRTEINTFILEHGRDIQVKLDKLDEAKASKKSKLYRILRSDLNDLKGLHSKINEGAQEREAIAYDSISGQVSQYLEQLKNERTPDLEAEISEYISQNEGKIRSMIEGIDINDRKENNELYKKLTADLTNLHSLKVELAKEVAVEGDENNVEYKHIDINNILSLENIAILNTNQDLSSRIINAINEYNVHLIDTDDKKAKCFKAVEDLRLEFLNYKRAFLEERSKMPNEKKKGGQGDKDKKKILYGKNEDAREEYSINNEDEDNRKNKTESKTWRPDKTTETKAPEIVSTPIEDDKNTVATPEEIFVVEEGVDYGEIIKDKKFDAWLNAIYKAMLMRNEAVSENAEDIESWYSKYQDAIPYIEKLNTIFDDIKRCNDKIRTLMSEDKVGALLYELCNNPNSTKIKIEAIYDSYEQTKEKEHEIERFNKMEEIKVAVSNRTGSEDLTDADVKSILEMSQENKEENVANLGSFLLDIYNNYDFYNSDSKSETDPNNIYYTFRKWSAAEQPEKPLGWWGRMKTRLFASLPQELRPEELNNFEALIKEMRKLDLVDRKSGGAEKAMANKTRLAEIIEFIGNDIPSESDLDDEGKKKLKIFNDLYKVFTNTKHKSNTAKQTAKRILDENTLDASIAGLTTRPVQDLLFETDSEKKIFEDDARYQINKDLLEELEDEINKFPKAKNPEKLKSIMTRFTEIETVLIELGNDTDDKLALDMVALKLHELILKNTKRDSYEELSASFATYDRIIKSETITKEKKIEYLNELIASLKTHENKSTNTMLQKATLNAIIKKYQAELTSLN
jgi:hypothetical protein